MKFYISRVLGNEVFFLLNEFLINDVDILSLFRFIKFVISERDVTWSTRLWAISQGSDVGAFLELWLRIEGNTSIL